MRPRGEIRRALGDAAWRLAVERAQQGMTYRDLAQRACVGFEVARRYVENMARAGDLQRVGQAPCAGVGRPMTLYVPASREADAGAPALAAVLQGWRTNR